MHTAQGGMQNKETQTLCFTFQAHLNQTFTEQNFYSKSHLRLNARGHFEYPNCGEMPFCSSIFDFGDLIVRGALKVWPVVLSLYK